MPHIPLLDEVALIAALGVVVTLVLSRLKLPAVAGLLLTGALVGPAGLRLVRSLEAIEVLSELGVVLLLFTIGLEFSLKRLTSIFKQVALGGALQVGLTATAVIGLAVAFGQPLGRAVFLGFVFSLSSTAIVLRALTERRELDAPHGRFIVGTLIFQDLCVIPMVLIVPLLGPSQTAGSWVVPLSIALAKAAGVVVVTITLARVLVPRLLGWVDASRSKELFLLAVLALCLGTAWLTGLAGLSLALGAFLGGMVVADTEYGHRAMGEVMPLRDAFMSIFFVSLGMFFDTRVLFAEPALVAVLALGFTFGKGFLATLAAMAMRFPARVAWLAGVGLAQFGEFGFVLARLAQQSGVIDADGVAPVLSAGIVSMFLTPLLVRAAPHIRAGERLLLPLEKVIGVRSIDQEDAERKEALTDHVLVVGYGVAGRVITRALAACGQRYLVLELNAETVREGRARGEPLFYADATSPEALAHAHLTDAKALLLVMNDPVAAERIVDAVKRVAPNVPVLMRTRFLRDRPGLMSLGAQEVVSEEVEGSLELLVRLLRVIETPRNVIEARVKEAREATHTSERKQTVPRRTVGELSVLSSMKVESVRVEPGSRAEGRSATDLHLHQTTGALVVAISRDGVLVPGSTSRQVFQAGDVAFVQGTGDAFRQVSEVFSRPAPTSGQTPHP